MKTRFHHDQFLCSPKTSVFFGWKDIYANLLLAPDALGVLLILIMSIIFLEHWNTPVVRASVGPIFLLILLSLLGTFASVVLFAGQPTERQCQARQVLFGLSFTQCVFCILVKSLKIVLALEFDPDIKLVLEKRYHPYVIIDVFVSLQVVICALWLALKPLQTKWEGLKNKQERLFFLRRMFKAFGAMLGYIGLLAHVGFTFAFKERNLPGSYNESELITFGMLIYFLCLVIFGPVYNTTTWRYHPALEMVVILISAYGILFCHFLLKCYIILFKKEANTQDAFQKEVWSFNSRDVLTESLETRKNSLGVLGGVENLGLQLESSLSSSSTSSSSLYKDKDLLNTPSLLVPPSREQSQSKPQHIKE